MTVLPLFSSCAVNRTQCLIVILVSHRCLYHACLPSYNLQTGPTLRTCNDPKNNTYTVKLHDDMFWRRPPPSSGNTTPRTKNTEFFVLSGFQREVEDDCGLLGDCAQRVVLIPDGPVFQDGADRLSPNVGKGPHTP